eukprot:8018648-Pyramimonas_sp.AAC.4
MELLHRRDYLIDTTTKTIGWFTMVRSRSRARHFTSTVIAPVAQPKPITSRHFTSNMARSRIPRRTRVASPFQSRH